MTACPGPDDLATVLVVEDSPHVAHVESCPACQRQLDDLAGPADASVLRLTPAEPSDSLRLVLDRLRAEAPPAFDAIRQTLPDLPPSDVPGSLGRLGTIDLRRVVGRGGMGIVFEGFDAALNRTVAVKVLAPHRLPDPAARERFLREARAAAALHHDHVVAVHAIDEVAGLPYLVLQFVDGESLAERLARVGRLPFEEVVALGSQVAKGLAAAHARGLVHRDVKPGNLLIDRATFHVRVADFGLAKAPDADALTELGLVAGTPAYMAPEQAAGGAVDARTDLFALGAVLSHAATGVLPFDGESPFVVLDRIRTHAPPRPRSLVPSLPAWFDDLVTRLLEKDPARRVATADDVARAFDSRTVAPRRRRWGVALAAVSAAGLVAVMVWFFRPGLIPEPRINPSPPSAPAVPRVGFVVEGREGEWATLAEAVALAPDGGAITVHGDGPFPSDTVRPGDKRLTVRAAPGSVPKFVPYPPGAKAPTQFLVAVNDLTLDGLDIDWPVTAPLFNRAEDSAVRCVVVSAGGTLTVSHCRVTSGEYGCGLGLFGKSATVTDSEFVAPRGSGIAWRPGPAPAPTLVARNSFRTHNALTVLAPRPSPVAPAPLRLESNLIGTDLVVRCFVDATPRHPSPIRARRNVFDAPTVLGVFGLRGFTQNFSTPDAMAEAAKLNVAWLEAENVYRKGTHYLEGNRPNLFATVPSDLVGLAAWCEFWEQPDARSAEGSILYREAGAGLRRFEGLEGASGTVPAEVGVHPDRTGPRGRR